MQQRNLVGCGTNPPAVRWPNDARIAVSVVVNYDEGSEYSTLDGGDPAGEPSGESPSPLALVSETSSTSLFSSTAAASASGAS